MSLNWREINRVLEEIPLENYIVRQIYQPSHPILILELYNRGNTFLLFFCFSNPYCRLHLIAEGSRLRNPAKLPRFVAFLRARIRDGRIATACQIGRERIIRIEVVKRGETLLLWVRLWGGAANLIVTDQDGTVLDALYRRPKRGEITGGHYLPEPSAAPPAEDDDPFSVREFPGQGSFNERVEGFYRELELGQERQRLTGVAQGRLERRENRLLAGLEALRKRLEEHSRFEQYKLYGDLILSHLHALQPGERWLAAEDFTHPDRRIDIELDPHASPAENAASYYKKYRRAKSALEHLREEIAEQEGELAAVRKQLAALAEDEDLAALKARVAALSAEGKRTKEPDREKLPGVQLSSGSFRILVGRTALENEALLRHHVRGNDTWLHARDYPGAYVFIRAVPGKSIPLETLLDAASLALHYSKGKASGQGDVYYTQVKFLRRVREGKAGQVIPAQEKNLFVKLDPQRLQRLLSPPL